MVKGVKIEYEKDSQHNKTIYLQRKIKGRVNQFRGII